MKRDKSRITPENITELKKNEVFVFGSNEAGVHGAGAALLAKQKFGAIEGKGWGPAGKTFAIPTKSWDVKGVLPLIVLECYVGRFSEYVANHPEEQFLVTKIGCGLAGNSIEDIAPLFAGFEGFKNVALPQNFWDVIDKTCREELVKLMSIECDDGDKNEL